MCSVGTPYKVVVQHDVFTQVRICVNNADYVAKSRAVAPTATALTDCGDRHDMSSQLDKLRSRYTRVRMKVLDQGAAFLDEVNINLGGAQTYNTEGDGGTSSNCKGGVLILYA